MGLADALGVSLALGDGVATSLPELHAARSSAAVPAATSVAVLRIMPPTVPARPARHPGTFRIMPRAPGEGQSLACVFSCHAVLPVIGAHRGTPDSWPRLQAPEPRGYAQA